MSIWFQYNNDEKLVMLQQTAAEKNVVEQAVEKDWWVSAILMALSKTSWADFLRFKGGTSLSKAWGLINRFSEDIDLIMSRSFFGLPEETKQQRTEIRRQTYHYIENMDYRTHYPDSIEVCPPDKLLNDWKRDYENLQESFIYDKSKKSFNELISRISELTDRIRKINVSPKD